MEKVERIGINFGKFLVRETSRLRAVYFCGLIMIFVFNLVGILRNRAVGIKRRCRNRSVFGNESGMDYIGGFVRSLPEIARITYRGIF